ncbi:MAG: ABC transporter ATP-binding protein [Oscillospiraceae bacterium]|nr:ABC transporter ATP-binding protein [Oscillospiraceae bacterium]
MENKTKDFLSVSNLVVTYNAGKEIVHAVNNVSFSLEKGQNLALVGETGAGKTSIAKAILRILPNPQGQIQNGTIVFDGKDLLSLNEREMRTVRGKRISMVFQDPMTALNPVKTVGLQIAEVIKKHDLLNKRDAMEKARQMLEMVGIPSVRYSEYPHQFSGGMKQRVVIAMALANKPDLLLADEPTSALDVTIQAQVLEMMSDLKQSLGTSIILITHDLGIVAKECDKVAVVYAGEIVEYGDKTALYKNPSHPYTVGLFGAIPDLYSAVRRLSNIEGLPPDPTDLPTGCYFHPRCPKATEKCRTEKPELKEIGVDHVCRCFYCKNQEGE